MKSKPLKHKTSNTFRFVPFAERINSINIRHAALYHIEHSYSKQPEENETHFHLAIQKWHVLNLTENFKKFRKETFGVVTVPQLVHRKDELLDILEKYLKIGDHLCLQPLLEILVSVAKDLREDFYPHFPKFLNILIELLDTKDAERLEWILICLAFLFKVLKPNLKKDVAVILNSIIPLLSENQPQYINNFAAESFAFVGRDIRDKKKFITLILNYLQVHDDAITGCGHLLFEIIRGVGGIFHSCIDVLLPALLEHLKESKEDQDILFKVLTQTIEDSLQIISHKEFSKFWSHIIKYMDVLKDDDINNRALEYILRLAGQVIEHQKGKYLLNPPQFVLSLVKVICEQSSETILEVCSEIGAVLLLSSTISLSQEHAGVIVKVLLPLPFPNILINFVNNLIDYPQFDMHILPPFINYVIQSEFDNDAMCTLSKICLKKSPLSMNGIKLFEWVKYPIELGKYIQHFIEHFDNAVHNDVESILENPSKLMNTLFCLPHIERINVKYCIAELGKLICKLLNILESNNIENHLKQDQLCCDTTVLALYSRKILFILGIVLESAVHISNCKGLREICDIDFFLRIILPYASNPNFLCALHLLDLYLTAYEFENGLSYPLLSLTDNYLKKNVSSPFHITRLVTTHVYKLFENLKELNKSVEGLDEVEKFTVFSRCYAVESLPPSIKEYRTQINMLQKLTFNSIQYALAKETDFHLFALNYMLGVLYFNFKLLWEPVTEFITGYGNALTTDDFWPVFYNALQTSFDNATRQFKPLQFDSEMNSKFDALNNLYADYNSISEKPDLCNYRNLILKVMTNFIQVCEAKNRDVVILFLKFIEEEYRKNDNANALKLNVEIHNDKIQVIDDKLQDIESDVIENLNDLDEPKESVSGKIIFKTLINIMQVLSQFKNPKALHREPVFYELFMEFLKHKNPGLQKYALDCVLNYKNKNITPYKNNLYNLVDEKKFKEELTLFKITEDAKTIQSEHREHVIPIILRILYGKMTTKLGADKKGGGQVRRSLAMRYLAGCNESELKMFIEMAFSNQKPYMIMKPKDIHESIVNHLDLKSITSPGKLHSILNLFEVVREYFGGYMKDSLLSELFKIFYAVCSTIATVLDQSDRVHIGYIKVMKNLRTIAITILRKLFEQFDKYPWSKDELFVIFETLLCPLIPKLHIEGIHSPTALLRLFNTWCQNPRYYILLVTSSEKDSISALPAMFKLLLAPKTISGVTNNILDMVEKLLTLTESDDDRELERIESFNTLAIPHDSKEFTTYINFGSKILIPHIPSILEVMKRRLANAAKSNTVNKRDLLILSRVTELVANPEICDELLNLLLPILVKKVCMNMSEDNMQHAIITISNLLGHSSNPQIYIKKIAILFNKVSPIDVRKLLIKLLFSIADRAGNNKDVITRMAHIVTELNAFNKRWIEQPDYDRRLDAYKHIYTLTEQNEVDVDLAVLIVNNCFYFIRTEKDIGLRDNAGLCLKKILPRLLMKYRSTSDGSFLVRDTVLSLISTGIRDNNNEILKNESIALLGELVRECPDADVVLSDLVPLANKDDVEVDFFENMCHLQMHRRVRALFKFCKVAKKMIKCPTPRTLTNFILPLVSSFICNDKYTDKNTLIDGCIDVVSTCCRLLPWYHYEVILKLYLNKMRHSSEYQKQLTRIITGIIDAFHFDFSKIKNIELPKIKNTSLPTGTDKKDVSKSKSDLKIVKEDSEVINQETNDTEPNDLQLDEDHDIESQLKAADEDAEIEDVTKEIFNIPAFERVTNVSPSVAKRIIKSLTVGLLPQLNRAIAKMTDHEESHKLNRRRNSIERQEEDMLRVPIALAVVKLLHRLPGDLLKHQLPGIIIKLCSFLKSPLKQIRIAARDVAKKIMVTVGATYLGVFLQHLTVLLTRGFQVHVLVATIHTVLDALKADFKAGDLNENLNYILDVCTNDLFGALSEEKEVDKLHYKTPEAKPSKKSYVTLMIVSQNITDKCLINLLLPFKDVLQKHHSKKVVMKVQEAFTHIASGLVTNKFIDVESLFVFLHGVASESIPEFVLGAPKREISESQKVNMLKAKPDCFIIPETPKRNKESQSKNVKVSGKANSHVLVEFSLNILYVILKREKVPRTECKAFVDPLIMLLVDALNSEHIKVTTVALKCITTLWTIRLSTPVLEEQISEIVKTIFLILHKYATSEISKQNDNYQLVRTAFKAVTFLIRNVKYYKLEADQLKTLLLYAEEDCQNEERQVNSFSLLKAILEGKLVAPELHEVMDKVSKICILSESARSRDEARMIFANYLTNYSLGKRMVKYIEFFLSQLNYELQHGRESSLKFLDMIINKLHMMFLVKQGNHLLLALGACMVNDPAPECRASAAGCIESMLKRIPVLERNKLYDLVLTFFQDTQPVHFELAAQLSSRFVIVENEEFKNRLPTVLSIVNSRILLLSNDISEGRFVKLSLEQSETKTDDEKQNEKDHSLIQILNLVEKITIHCASTMKSKKYENDYDEIGQHCQALLGYPHSWVRLKAVGILAQILSVVDGEELDLFVRNKGDVERGFIYHETEVALRSLVLDLCAQYTPTVSKDMAEQVTSVLFVILKLIHSTPSFKLSKKIEIDKETEDVVGGGRLNLRWILFKLRKAVNVEVARAPVSMNIRSSIFTMWTHVISFLESEDIIKIVDVILPPIVRELSTGDAMAPASIAKQLAGRLGKKLRRKIGDIEYSKLVADAQTRLNIRRAERRKLLLQEKVKNPEKAAKRKLQLKEKKKQSKKVKLDTLHGKRPRPKKRKAEDIDIEDNF